jgi:hypothetical protein
MARPEEFVGRAVAFHASVEGDGEHLTLLWDPSCRRGLRFHLKSARPSKSAEAIHDAAWGTDAGTLGEDIQGDFTATLARTDEKTMWPQAAPYFLDVATINNLVIKPTSQR